MFFFQIQRIKNKKNVNIFAKFDQPISRGISDKKPKHYCVESIKIKLTALDIAVIIFYLFIYINSISCILTA